MTAAVPAPSNSTTTVDGLPQVQRRYNPSRRWRNCSSGCASMRGDELKERAILARLGQVQFGTLSRAELTLLHSVAIGKPAYCSPSEVVDDPANDPSQAQSWGPDRQIRAELIRWLCLDRRAREHVPQSGIVIMAAKITGGLDLSNGTVPFPLSLWWCMLTDEAELHSLEIHTLNFRKSWTRLLAADRAKVKGSVLLGGIRTDGGVDLAHAQIAGNLEFDDATLIRSKSPGSSFALYADAVVVGGSLLLRRVRAEGEVRLLSAQIGGNLECDGGQFKNLPRSDVLGSGIALSADSATVKGAVFLRDHFQAEGEVRLPGAQIGGELDCDHGTFLNPPRGRGTILLGATGTFALKLEGATVKGSVRLRDGFRAEGAVDLMRSHIEGDLDSAKGEFESAILYLTDASVGAIIDDDKSWPRQGQLYLDGLVYARVAGGPRDVEKRLMWLGLQPEKPFARQPYFQLAKVFRESGDGDGAASVLVEMERRRRKYEYHTLAAELKSWVLRETIGYGYDPMRSVWAIVGLSALGWIVYRRSYLAGNIVPREKDAYESFRTEGEPPAYYDAFAPLVYSLENSLPLVKLGQVNRWQPNPRPESISVQSRNLPTIMGSSPIWSKLRWVQRLMVFCGFEPDPKGERAPSSPSRWGTSARFLRWFVWVQILLGWLLATLFAGGVTGIIHRE